MELFRLYKLSNQLHRKILWVLFFLFTTENILAQGGNDTDYGVVVVRSQKTYRQQITIDSNLKFIELHTLIPGLQYDLRYAGFNNFVHQPVYPTHLSTTYLRLPAARALQQVAAALKQQGLGLKIFDAYRPFSVTVRFWELVKDERYVAHPSKGSGHNRGLAVDLTIIRLDTKEELNMGTGFDHFSDTAHHSFMHLPEPVLSNRIRLRTIMEKYGFSALETEWWHYYWPNDRNYDLLDFPFQQLKKLIR